VTSTKYVYDFAEGNKELKDLLGGKGANLAEMTKLGLPVPPGFTITTDACRLFLTTGSAPASLDAEIDAHIAHLEAQMGRTVGDPAEPLLLSVRSGAKFSMPGMMETVLNIGLNDESVHGLIQFSGNERFAWDSYRRLIQMYGKTVCEVPGEEFEHLLDALKRTRGVAADIDLTAEDLKGLVADFRKVFEKHTGQTFPQDPKVQLRGAIEAVFNSWNAERAVLYRRQERIPADLGTAVNVQVMVFGNISADSGTGVAFTRDPSTGETGVYGDYLVNAQGEDVVAGIRNTVSLSELETIDKNSYDRLMAIMAQLESHYKDLCDIEFTVERSKLWMLQTRVGKRTAAAAFRIATQLVDEGTIDLDEALTRVNGAQLMQLMFPTFDLGAKPKVIAKGVAASPGAAVGKVVFHSSRAVELAEAGERAILVRRETNPDDLPGMIAAQGILTSRGGKTSHAAVVARGMGKTCVCGADVLNVDVVKKTVIVDGITISEGDLVSIDGTSGKVYLGEVPVQPSPVVRYFEGDTAAVATDALVAAVDRILKHADGKRRLLVRTNADTGPDAERARRFGAQGIGLCRTEHMFLGDRRELVERLILAVTSEDRQAALDALLPMQRSDFVEIFTAMDGLPVTIRLIDPPLHEFLPSHDELPHGRRGESQGRGPGPRRRVAGGRDPPARVEPDAGSAWCPARPSDQGPVRDAGPGDRRGVRRAQEGRQGPPARGHGSAGRCRAGAGVGQGVGRGRHHGRGRGDRRRGRDADRHHDRDPEGRPDRRRHRGQRAVLLLRYQRPDPDDLGLLARRRRGFVLLQVPGAGHLRGFAVRVPGPGRRWQARADRGRGRAGHPPEPQDRGLRRARRRPRVGALLPRGRAELRVVLAVPGAGCPARGRSGRGRLGGFRQPLRSLAGRCILDAPAGAFSGTRTADRRRSGPR
jgi:pyruvate,orthophosphate dikinase